MKALLVFLCAAAAFLMACGGGAVDGKGGPGAVVKAGTTPPSRGGLEVGGSVSILMPGGSVVSAELADDPETRRVGLMFRESLPEDGGMLLAFPQEGPAGIWMKNCLVSLDLVWLDGAGVVLAVEENAPPCTADPCAIYDPDVAARYVLELPAGRAGREGLRPGSRLQIVSLAPVIPH